MLSNPQSLPPNSKWRKSTHQEEEEEDYEQALTAVRILGFNYLHY